MKSTAFHASILGSTFFLAACSGTANLPRAASANAFSHGGRPAAAAFTIGSTTFKDDKMCRL